VHDILELRMAGQFFAPGFFAIVPPATAPGLDGRFMAGATVNFWLTSYNP
jgi:hypothetical protein